MDDHVVRRSRKWNFSLPSHLHESKDEEAIVLLLVELAAHSAGLIRGSIHSHSGRYAEGI